MHFCGIFKRCQSISAVQQTNKNNHNEQRRHFFFKSSVHSEVNDSEIDKINEFCLQYFDGEEDGNNSVESEENVQSNQADLTLNDSHTVSPSISSPNLNGSTSPVAASTPKNSDDDDDDEKEEEKATILPNSQSLNESSGEDDDNSEWQPNDSIEKRVMNENISSMPASRAKSTRNANKPHPRYATFAYAFMSCDPSTFKQAVSSESVDLWKGAMKEKFDSLQKNQT